MKKAWVRIASFFLAVVVLINSGILIGMRKQNKYEAYDYVVSKENSKTIAIINQDLGVVYDGTDMNISLDLINTLDDNYVLVSKAEGEHGLLNGTYGAVITFPSDFTQKVFTINNSKPEKAEFFYDISPILNKSDTIEVLLNILQFESTVQENISYMYLYSIMNEVHEAQETTEKVLDSSNKALRSVNLFADKDYSFNFEFSPSEIDSPTLELPDFSEYIGKSRDIKNNMDSVNSRTSNDINEEYRKITASVDIGKENSSRMSDAIGDINILKPYFNTTSYTHFFDYVEATATDDTARILADIGISTDNLEIELLLSIKDTRFNTLNLTAVPLGHSEAISLGLSVSERTDDLNEDIKDIVEQTYVSDFESDLRTTLGMSSTQATLGMSLSPSDIDNICVVVMDTVPNYPSLEIENTIFLFLLDIEDYYEKYIHMVQALQIESDELDVEKFLDKYVARQADKVDTSFDEFRTTTSKTMDRNNFIRSSFNDLTKYVNNHESSTKSNLNSINSQSGTNYQNFIDLLTAFRIVDYFDKNADELENLYDNFYSNQDAWNTIVDNIIGERDDLMANSYDFYSAHVDKIMEETNLSREDAELLLNQSTEDLLVAQLLKNQEIDGLMGEFSNKLPYSKIGGLPNSDYYNVVVSPATITSTGNAVGANYVTTGLESKGVSNEYSNIVKTLIVALSISALLVAFIFIKKMLQKQGRKEK